MMYHNNNIYCSRAWIKERETHFFKSHRVMCDYLSISYIYREQCFSVCLFAMHSVVAIGSVMKLSAILALVMRQIKRGLAWPKVGGGGTSSIFLKILNIFYCFLTIFSFGI